jgi:hypothetical protein
MISVWRKRADRARYRIGDGLRVGFIFCLDYRLD